MPEEPLHTTTFTLTRADALAYEQAGSRMTPLGVLALLLWLGLCGVVALFVPAEWAGPRFGLSSALLISIAVAIGYVLALLLMAMRQWLRARRRLRRPMEVTVSEWPDRLELSGAGMPRTVPLGEVRRAILNRAYLFLDTDEDVIILPRRAFPEEGSIEELARRIEGVPRPAPEAAAVDPLAPSA